MSTPVSGDKKNIVKMAYIYFQEGRWDKAIEEYKKLVAMDPEDLNTHNMLGDVYVKKGSAVEAFDAYIKVSSDFSARGQMDKALVVNKKIAALDSSGFSEAAKNKQWLIKQTLKADSAIEQENLTEAIEALSEVVKADPENLSAYSKLAELFEKQGKVNEAIQQYLAIGSAFLKNRLFKKAQEMFQKIVQLEPGNLDTRINLAQIFIKQGSESDAKKEFLSIAELAYAQNDLDKALLYANKAIEFKSIEAHYILGLIFFKKQQYSEAKSEFESLLRFKINHAGALIHLGLVLSEQGQLEKAVESIQKALKVEKDHLGALEALAEISLKKGSKAEAVKAFGDLIGRYEAKGLLPKAVEVAQKIVSLDANDFLAVGRLGELLKEEGQKDKAVEAFRKAAGLATTQGKSDQASVWMARAQELNPTVAPAAAPAPPPVEAPAPPPVKASEKVMDLEDEAPAPPPAPAAAPAPPVPVVVEKPPVPEDPQVELNAQLAIADNYLKQNLVEEAIEIFQQLLEAHPDHQEIRVKLNQAYTAYVKTGDDVIGALEAEKKAKEDEERRIREEMERKSREEAAKLQAELEQKARAEAERQAQAALDQKAREEAEGKAREEIERKIRDEVAQKAKKESDEKLREELDQKVRVEMERKIREETEKKIRAEIEQKMKAEAEQKLEQEKAQKQKLAPPAPKEKTAAPLSKLDAHSKTDSTLEESRDEFMTIAVAEIYTRQGLYAEAIKIYQRIIHAEPDNFEAKKKLSDVESLSKNKAGKSSAAAPTPGAPVPPPPASEAHKKPSEEENSGGKKKSNRVGYV
ncbi:MAG: tetratricopeptide repeat protein [bacterium]